MALGGAGHERGRQLRRRGEKRELNRSEAIRRLVELGLKAKGQKWRSLRKKPEKIGQHFASDLARPHRHDIVAGGPPHDGRMPRRILSARYRAPYSVELRSWGINLPE
jgi:hypothetical protein